MTKEQYDRENSASNETDVVVVPSWWRWDPMQYDYEKYPVEPPKDDPVWKQPEWEKPVYKHPDGWTPEPPMDNPDMLPMHNKPWEPEPEHKPHNEAQPHQHYEHGYPEYVPSHTHDIPPHVHLPSVYPEPQNPININIDIDNSSNANSSSRANASAESVAKAMSESLSFAASHGHHGKHDSYHDFCDDLFNWGETTYKNVMPTHKESYAIEDYYARIYDNGQAVGEKNGNVYHYDGDEINYVGTVDEVAGWAGMEMMG